MTDELINQGIMSGPLYLMSRRVGLDALIRNEGVRCSNHRCGTNSFNILGMIFGNCSGDVPFR